VTEQNNNSIELNDETDDPGYQESVASSRTSGKAKQASRSTVARQERRIRSEAKKARKRRIYTAGGSLIALALIAGLVLPSIGGGISTASETSDQVVKNLTGEKIEIQPGEIITDASVVQYATTPPTSGPRLAQLAEWGFHSEQVNDGIIVRNLEYGGVVFNHGLQGNAVQELKAFVEGLPGYPGCYLVNPYPGIQDGQVVMTAWGWTHEVKADNTNEMDQFAKDHRNKGPLYINNACEADVTLNSNVSGERHSG